jgi:hypothetical protein
VSAPERADVLDAVADAISRVVYDESDPIKVVGRWAIDIIWDAVAPLAAAAERDRMRAMRHDFQTSPHAEFPKRWPDWRVYEEVLPTRCDCAECRLWRSGS